MTVTECMRTSWVTGKVWGMDKAMTPLLAAAGAMAALALSGCGIATAPAAKSSPTVPVATVAGLTGTVMGGQQPVAGVTLQMYAAGSGSYGAASMPLFPEGSVKTTPSGNFTFPAFTCPSGSPLLYLVGTGGTPIGGSANANLSLMVGLGPCSSVSSIPFIDMNELTTVATVWSLAGFMTGPANIGAPTSNAIGLANAFAAINKVVNIETGTAVGPALPAGATLPVEEIDALGDILQNCVNSAGGSASDTTDGLTDGTPCGKLFYLTTVSSAPTDVITAAMNLAQHPYLNTAKLDDLQASSPAFTPALSVNAPPSSWTIAINYTAGGLSTPHGLANDAEGNVWLANGGGSSVVELSNVGAPLSGASGYTAGGISSPYAVAIDQSGFVWVANSGNNSVTKLAATGATGTNYTGNGLSNPLSIAVDGAGTVWVGDVPSSGNASVSAFTNSGSPLTGSPFTGGGIVNPRSIAIDPK